MTEAILFDTHVAIWLSEGVLPEEHLATIVDARLAGRAFISPVTAWEVGLLASRRRYDFKPSPHAWFDQLVREMRLVEVDLTSRLLLDSAALPGDIHADPADRMLVATARALGVPLMTRDRAILAYAAQGHVTVIPC